MSEADKMFENLGYKKYTSDDCVMYMKDLFLITFVIDNKTFVTEYKQGDYNFPKVRPFEVNMQELQTINMKVKELRLDMILMLVILNYINDCKKIGKEKLAVSLSGRLFSYFLCVPLPIFAGLILIEVL